MNSPITFPLMKRRSLFGLVFAILLPGCHKEQKPPEPPTTKIDGESVCFIEGAPQKSSISVETAEPRKLAITHLTGRLYWNEETTVRIFTPVAGRVISVLADLGQPVSQNTTLAEIDSPDFNQALSNARTGVGNLAMADKAFSRAQQLLEHGAAAQKDVEAAEAAFVAARAERDRAEAVLANYGGSLKGTNSLYLLRSPLVGDLVEKNINPGQEVRADLMLANAPNLFVPLFVVSDPTTLWLQLDVAEPDLATLQPGQELRVHCQAFPDKVFIGSVGKIGATMDSSTRTLKVRGVVRNPDKLLRAEMYVTVDVVEDATRLAQAGVEVPSKAVFTKGNDAYLFIERSSGQYQRQRVKLGIEQDGKVPVLEGVSVGQKVVTEGALLLQALLENGNS